MGRTLEKLAEGNVNDQSIFNNRFVVECCEAFHVHYRNLRIILSEPDFISMATGMKDALKRWEDRGRPEAKQGTHIELCRKPVATKPIDNDSVKVNLNENLYAKHEGKIFSEGAGLEGDQYIHLKIRDLRIELTLDEFNNFAETVKQAQANLNAKV